MNSAPISPKISKRMTVGTEAWIVTTLLVIFPLMQAFSFLRIFIAEGMRLYKPGLVNLDSTLNFTALFAAFVLMGRHKLFNRFRPSLLFLLYLFLITYSINFLVTPYASSKWLINTMSFIFIFCIVAKIIIQSNDFFLMAVQKKMKLVIKFSVGIIMLLSLIALFSDPQSVIGFFLQGHHNLNIYMLTKMFGINKEALGLIFNLIVLWHMVFWALIDLKRKIVFIVFLIILFPFWIGIRTSILTLFIIAFYLMMNRKLFKKIVFISSVPAFLVVALQWENIFKLVQAYYDRLPSLLFALNTLKSDPFGLGNGGFHFVTQTSQEFLFAQYAHYGNENIRRFMIAPESDLVYFIASFGILSLVFFGFYAYLLIKARYVIKNNSVPPIAKFFLLGCIVMIFMGISQDVAGKLMWWLYMGVGFGVIVKYPRRGGRTTQWSSRFSPTAGVENEENHHSNQRRAR